MLDRTRTVLVVTDIQGRLAELAFERESLYRHTGIMIDGIRALDIPVIWMEQYPEGLGPTVPEVARHLDGIDPIAKRTFSSLADPAFTARFNELGRDQVLLTGIETHVCIQQTALDLIGHGCEVQVVADAVSSRTAFNKQIGLDKIARAGGIVTSTETALFELLGAADDPAFKTILSLVKSE